MPLIRLPIERNGGSAEDVAKEKERIREKILGVSNEDLFKDEETWELLETLGGDLMINAFACNFRINGKANTDIVSHSTLSSRRIYLQDTGRSKLPQPAHLPTSILHY